VCAFHADRAARVKGTRSTWDDPIKGGWFAKKALRVKIFWVVNININIIAQLF
jgi:hypothetical protein